MIVQCSEKAKKTFFLLFFDIMGHSDKLLVAQYTLLILVNKMNNELLILIQKIIVQYYCGHLLCRNISNHSVSQYIIDK